MTFHGAKAFIWISLILCNCYLTIASETPKTSPSGHDEVLGDGQGGSHNLSSHDNSSHGNKSHSSHASIHVASWQFEYVQGPLIISLFVLVAGISKLGFHHADFLVSIVPESCLLIAVGTITGAIIYAADTDNEFDTQLYPKTFFLFLLPPIILEASYSLHDRVFFDNIGSIMIYAVLGTVINCFTIGPILYGLASSGGMGGGDVMNLTMIQCLVFSALIVAVDPVAVLAIFQEVHVNNVLYFLVFGESLFNDAVTVVLYNMMKTFNEMEVIEGGQIGLGFLNFLTVSLGGTFIGLLFGAITSFFTKFTKNVRVVEPLAVFSLAYLSYIAAELFHFSGIISIIFCGLVQAQYAFHNLSHKSHITVKYFTKMMSATCDSIIFLFLGFALVRRDHHWHTGFVGWTVLLCLLVRFIVVYGITFVMNFVKGRVRQITAKEQFIMSYGGLRGAVCFSLVTMLESDKIPFKNMFQTTVLAIIIFTVFVQGMTIKPFVNLLSIRRANVEKQTMFEAIHGRVTDHVMAGVEEILGKFGNNQMREWCSHLDDKYLKHWLQRIPTRNDENLMELYEQIALREHYANLYGEQAERKIEEVKKGIPPTRSVAQGLSIMFAADAWKFDTPEKKTDELIKKTTPESRRRTLRQLSKRQSFDDAMIRHDKDDEMHEPVTRRPRLRRHSAIGQLMSKISTRGSQRLSSIPTVDQVQDILQSSNGATAMHRKYDRNLSRDHDNDLLHQLQQKSARQSRLFRSLSTTTPPFMTAQSFEDRKTTSLEDIPEHGETPFRSRSNTESCVPRTMLEREKAKNGMAKKKEQVGVDVTDHGKNRDHRLDAMDSVQARAMQTLMEDTLGEDAAPKSDDVFAEPTTAGQSSLRPTEGKPAMKSVKTSPMSKSLGSGHKLSRMHCIDIPADSDIEKTPPPESPGATAEDPLLLRRSSTSETQV